MFFIFIFSRMKLLCNFKATQAFCSGTKRLKPPMDLQFVSQIGLTLIINNVLHICCALLFTNYIHMPRSMWFTEQLVFIFTDEVSKAVCVLMSKLISKAHTTNGKTKAELMFLNTQYSITLFSLCFCPV